MLELTKMSVVWYALGAIVLVVLATKGRARWLLSRAKHRSLAGHAQLARRVARLLPFYEYDAEHVFAADDALAEVVDRRRAAFERLTEAFRARFSRTLELTREVAPAIPDLQFTAVYRVPFQFSRFVAARLSAGSFLQASRGVQVTDLDGNTFYDLTGSYGVNVYGYDRYKRWIEAGMERVRELGPVLGAYHPVIAYDVKRLREISGLPEVSFHMSGTEAMMQAVRLARYHTGRSHLVRFCGAYHGFWGDVQPGVGNPVPAHETYTLKDLDERALEVLRTRRDIACVLVNPLQALHPNSNAPSDASLVDGSRTAHFDRAAYTRWLERLRRVCSERGIVLIFDEVFLGFRLARGGAQEYFGVRADLVTYGKTLGGGLPVGVVCGRAELMKRFKDDRPTDVCFARGTFNSHPYVLGAMAEFLQWLEQPEAHALYRDLDACWDSRARALNRGLSDAQLPVRVANLSSVWTICYLQPSRYNWMFQYYLRLEGLALSWVGSGRLIFSLDYSDADFEEVCRRFVAAATRMQDDGFFFAGLGSNRAIRRRILSELVRRRFGIAIRGVARVEPSGPSDRSAPLSGGTAELCSTASDHETGP
jgi:glutamate-1-semialdehyde 2,1-aminomutase